MDIREDLKAYIDGELTPERAEEVRVALESDKELQEELAFMKLLTKEIKSAEKPIEVSGAEKALGSVRFRSPFGWKPFAVGAGIVVLLALIGYLSPEGRGLFNGDMAQDGDSGVATATLSPEDRPAGGKFTDYPQSESMADVGQSRESTIGTPEAPSNSKVAADSMPAPTGSAAPPMLLQQRQIIMTGDMHVEVADPAKALLDAEAAVKALGGYAESTNSTTNEGIGQASGTFRVPVKNFEQARKTIATLGTAKSNSSNSQEVTTQVADIDARLRVLRAEEDQYVTLLGSTRRIGEILQVKERLSQVRQEIESLDAQQKSLRGLSSMSTINVNFTQKPKIDDEPKPDDWLDRTYVSAVTLLKGIGRLVLQGLIFVGILAPVWLPIAYLIWRASRRKVA